MLNAPNLLQLQSHFFHNTIKNVLKKSSSVLISLTIWMDHQSPIHKSLESTSSPQAARQWCRHCGGIDHLGRAGAGCLSSQQELTCASLCPTPPLSALLCTTRHCSSRFKAQSMQCKALNAVLLSLTGARKFLQLWSDLVTIEWPKEEN